MSHLYFGTLSQLVAHGYPCCNVVSATHTTDQEFRLHSFQNWLGREYVVECLLVLIGHIFIARKQSLQRLYFYTCLSFCPQGVLPQCMMGYQPPRTRHPPDPRADTPLGNRYPPGPGIPLEQTPHCTVHAGRYGQHAGVPHPTGMQSCYDFTGIAWSPQILVLKEHFVSLNVYRPQHNIA